MTHDDLTPEQLAELSRAAEELARSPGHYVSWPVAVIAIVNTAPQLIAMAKRTAEAEFALAAALAYRDERETIADLERRLAEAKVLLADCKTPLINSADVFAVICDLNSPLATERTKVELRKWEESCRAVHTRIMAALDAAPTAPTPKTDKPGKISQWCTACGGSGRVAPTAGEKP